MREGPAGGCEVGLWGWCEEAGGCWDVAVEKKGSGYWWEAFAEGGEHCGGLVNGDALESSGGFRVGNVQ